jgi:hypothetical protein
MVPVELQLLGEKLPRKTNRVLLEVVTEREVAEHLEERLVPRGVADLLEIVVLSSGSNAFLGRSRATPERRILLTKKNALELHHSGVGEEQRRIVSGNERARRADDVAVPLEVFEKLSTNFG